MSLTGASSQRSTQQKEDKARKYSDSPKGLYLYGSVGCGKTMLMDFFHQTSHVNKKQRIHFHQFMLDVHKRKLHTQKHLLQQNFLVTYAY